MQVPVRRRFWLVWVVLSITTVASWLMASARGRAEFSPSTAVSVGILAAAAIKARLIIRQFMDVRAAPGWLRGITDGWLALLVVFVIALDLW